MKKMFKRILLVILAISTLSMVACSGEEDSQDSSKDQPIVVSSKDYTESELLGKITIKYLQEKGYEVEDETGISGQGIIRKALESGEVDTYWEFTGTAYMEFMKKELDNDDPEDVYEEVKEWDMEENNLVWLNHSTLNNTYCFVTTEEVVKENNIKSISDLAKAYNEEKNLKFIANPEYFERADGMPKINKEYDFEIPNKNRVLLELGMFYNALINKEGDFTVGFTTDGMIKAKDLIVLEDDKNVFPVYYGTPVFRKEIIEAYPELSDDMDELIEKIDTETMIDLNSQVDIDKKTVDEVSEQFLKDNDLIK